jgi:hypothetical protein
MCGIKTGNMKKIFGLLAGAVLLTGFSFKEGDPLDGLWIGYYKSDLTKQKIIVKLSADDHIEFYAGGFNEQPQCNGSYKLTGDTLSFTYTAPGGDQYVMKGHVSRKKNYIDGIWNSKGSAQGSFFMEKQDIEEKIVQP